MKIKVEFISLPNVAKMVGGKSILIDFQGGSIEDLLAKLVESFGPGLGRFLLDESGQLDAIFRVVLNKNDWLSRDQLNTDLQDGDRVTFMLLTGGG